jgi:uncharacterized membrane protein required for colicin V production
VNFGEFVAGLTWFDLVVGLYLFAFFILGFIQGTLRRVLGIGQTVFSFLLAANLREPLGAFFASNWNQFPDEYAYLIAFLLVFAAATVVFTLLIQSFYTTQALWDKSRFLDEAIGGILGLVQAVLYLAILVVILDSFFQVPGIPESPGELPFIRQGWLIFDASRTAIVVRDTILPVFFTIFGIFIPSEIERLVLDYR